MCGEIACGIEDFGHLVLLKQDYIRFFKIVRGE
jgi:hypothetical protein